MTRSSTQDVYFHSRSDSARGGFTLFELLVVVAVVGILVTLVGVSSSQMMRRAAAVKCLSNLRQVGSAFSLYGAENNGTYPAANPGTIPDCSWSGDWFNPRTNGLGSSPAAYGGGLEVWKKITVCPANITPAGTYQYAVNYNVMVPSGVTSPVRAASVDRKSQIVVMGDATTNKADWGSGLWGPSSGWKRLANRHGETANILWADFHVSTVNKDDLVQENFK